MKKLVLASASPRRRELLAQIGLDFEVAPGQGEEIITKTEPKDIVMELAEAKAKEVYNGTENMVVIGADTIVVHHGHLMGKPADKADAETMLTELCGDTHQVYTGVAFLWQEDGKDLKHTFYECTDVSVYPAEREEIKAYIETGEPMDKAGAYGIQGRFAAWIRRIEGDYSNVVGLPAGRVYQELKAKGLLEKTGNGRNGRT